MGAGTLRGKVAPQGDQARWQEVGGAGHHDAVDVGDGEENESEEGRKEGRSQEIGEGLLTSALPRRVEYRGGFVEVPLARHVGSGLAPVVLQLGLRPGREQ